MSAADEDKKEPEVEEKEEVKIPEQDITQPPSSPAEEAPSESMTPDQPLEKEAPSSMEQPTAAAAAPPMPEQPVSPQAAAPSEPVTPEQEAQKATAENLAFANDLKYGKIQPKTYQDLYADKSTIGKVGTLFGLMLSGAGSGITGQPNAVLHMMDRQIDRDLEAQKANQANKQSWYHYSLQHAMNQPEIAMKLAQAEGIQNDNAKKQYINAQLGIAQTQGLNDAKNHSMLHVAQELQDTIMRMPPGAQRDQAQLSLDNVVMPGIIKEISQNNQQMAQKKAMVNAANPMPTQKPNPPPVKGPAKSGVKYDALDERKLNAMIQKGKVAPEAPDAIAPGMMGEVNSEIEKLKTNRNNLADADAAFNALAGLKNAGQIPAAGALGSLGTALGAVTGGVGSGGLMAGVGAGLGHLAGGKAGEALKDYFERNRQIQLDALKTRLGRGRSESEAQSLAESLLPKWTDTPESREEAHHQLVRHFESDPAEAAPTLSRLGVKYPLPKYQYSAPELKKQAPPKASPKYRESNR